MPRSSRHESSHRGHKHSSREAEERSDSEERSSRERRTREEELATGGSGSRASRDSEYERRNGSSSSLGAQGKEVSGSENGEDSGDRGKKKKGRPAESGAVERCNGGNGQDKVEDREVSGEEVMHAEMDERVKGKVSAVDSKSRSSRKYEGSSEKKEGTIGKDDSAKRRSEKEYSRRESSVHHKDVKDRERERVSDRDREQGFDRVRERRSDRDRNGAVHRSRENGLEKEQERASVREKKSHDARRERSSDASSRKQGGRAFSFADEGCRTKADGENVELQIQEEQYEAELEKESEEQTKKRTNDFREKDKWQEDNHDGENNFIVLKNDKLQREGRDEDKRLSFREVRSKTGGHKDEYHRDGNYRDKYRNGMERLQKNYDDKIRDDRLSRDHATDRSSSKHYRDEKVSSDSHSKRSKHQDSDHDGSPYTDDRGGKYKDSRGRKRPYNENEDHTDMNPRNSKELCASSEKNAVYPYSIDSGDRNRSENVFPEKDDYSSSRPRGSPISSAQYFRDQYRHSSKQVEVTTGNILSEDRMSEHQSSEKSRPKGERRIDDLSFKNFPSKHERSPRSDVPGSPVQFSEKSPSTSERRRRSSRAGMRPSLDTEEMGQRSSILKDGATLVVSENKDHGQPKEKSISDERPQADLSNSYPVPAASTFNRADSASGGFPTNILQSRLGAGSPILGSFDEDNRAVSGDRKSVPRYKRHVEFNMSRGQGNAWRGIQGWPSPVANGFIPFQHLPPSGGFHPVVQQFPPPSLFGIRPSMDMGHPGIHYPMHEAPERFPNQARPFGWRNLADDSCPPHLQGWDGNSGIPLDESHVYRRPDWEQSRHLLNNRGWEVGIDGWKGQNGNNNPELSLPRKEDYATHQPSNEKWPGQPARQPVTEVRSPDESNEVKKSNDASLLKVGVEMPPTILYEQTPESFKSSKDESARLCCFYLSKLDISADLARPELYKQCMNLIGSVDPIQSKSYISNGYFQEIGRDTNEKLKGSRVLSSQFPAIPESVFQRAMSLYKKRSEETKAPLQVFMAKDKTDSSTAEEVLTESVAVEKSMTDSPAVEKVEPCEDLASGEVSHDVNPPDNEDSNILANVKSMEELSDAAMGVVCVEDPQACEGLMQECRLNLSRIHHSPENTH